MGIISIFWTIEGHKPHDRWTGGSFPPVLREKKENRPAESRLQKAFWVYFRFPLRNGNFRCFYAQKQLPFTFNYSRHLQNLHKTRVSFKK